MPEEEHRRLGIWEIGQGLEAWLGRLNSCRKCVAIAICLISNGSPQERKVARGVDPNPGGEKLEHCGRSVIAEENQFTFRWFQLEPDVARDMLQSLEALCELACIPAMTTSSKYAKHTSQCPRAATKAG